MDTEIADSLAEQKKDYFVRWTIFSSGHLVIVVHSSCFEHLVQGRTNLAFILSLSIPDLSPLTETVNTPWSPCCRSTHPSNHHHVLLHAYPPNPTGVVVQRWALSTSHSASQNILPGSAATQSRCLTEILFFLWKIQGRLGDAQKPGIRVVGANPPMPKYLNHEGG